MTVSNGDPIGKQDLLHWLGLPLGFYGTASALPLRGYNLIFNEWYRDQDLTSERAISLASGSDSTTVGGQGLPASAAWTKDYFTTARPYAQKGPAIRIPMDTDPVAIDSSGDDIQVVRDGSTNRNLYSGTDGDVVLTGAAPTAGNIKFGTNTGLEADLSDMGGLITELRIASALQRFEEARYRYGSRFTEYLRYLGVRPSDQRLQRPEYLGGGKNTLQISEVLQTAPVYDSTEEELVGDVGSLKGHGIGTARSNKYMRFFEEHGYVHTFMTVMPIPIYSNGTDRHWFKSTKYDFFQKELQHVGQQEVYTKEVYGVGDQGSTVFGYQDRYSEYMQGRHRVTGDFADSSANYWHFAREFGEPPTLNNAFVTGTPTNRPFADQSGMELMVMMRHSIRARRIVQSGVNSVII